MDCYDETLYCSHCNISFGEHESRTVTGVGADRKEYHDRCYSFLERQRRLTYLKGGKHPVPNQAKA